MRSFDKQQLAEATDLIGAWWRVDDSLIPSKHRCVSEPVSNQTEYVLNEQRKTNHKAIQTHRSTLKFGVWVWSWAFGRSILLERKRCT